MGRRGEEADISHLKMLTNLNRKIILWHPIVYGPNKTCVWQWGLGREAGAAQGLPFVKSDLRQASSSMQRPWVSLGKIELPLPPPCEKTGLQEVTLSPPALHF